MNTRNLTKGLALTLLSSLLTLSIAEAKWAAGDKIPAPLKQKFDQAATGGDKIILVDFWASWCGPCKKSFPEMEILYSKYKVEGFSIVAVNLDEKEKAMETFLKRMPINFPVIADSDKSIVQSAELDAIPSSFLIDQSGTIRFVHQGWHGKESAEELALQIETLLKEIK